MRMDAQQRADIEHKLAQAQLATVETLLTIKKVRWYEIVLFTGFGITIGLALAKIFWIDQG
jgi:hypothetical protein